MYKLAFPYDPKQPYSASNPGIAAVSRLSIIIPVLGNPTLLDDTLVSVLENRPAHCEILVVHAKPYDDPYDLAGEVRFIEAGRKAGWIECVNLALAASESPFVHTLACGVEVSAGWADAALRRFHEPRVAAVAAVMLDRDNRQRVVSAGLGYGAEGVAWRIGQGASAVEVGRSAGECVGPDTLAAFYRKSALEAAGGFMPYADNTLMSIDAALCLHRTGFCSVLAPECVVWTDAAATRPESGFRFGRDAERLFWRWAATRGRVRSLAAHAALVAGQCTIGLWRPNLLAQCIGRLWGVCRPAAALPRTDKTDTLPFDESQSPARAA